MGLQGTALDAAVHLAACQVAAGRPTDALEVLADRGARPPAPRRPCCAASVALVRVAGVGARRRRCAGLAEVADAGIAAARRLDLRYELGLPPAGSTTTPTRARRAVPSSTALGVRVRSAQRVNRGSSTP